MFNHSLLFSSFLLLFSGLVNYFIFFPLSLSMIQEESFVTKFSAKQKSHIHQIVSNVLSPLYFVGCNLILLFAKITRSSNVYLWSICYLTVRGRRLYGLEVG